PWPAPAANGSGEKARDQAASSLASGAPGESLPAATGQRRAGPAVRRRGSFAPFTDIKKSLYLRCRRLRGLLLAPPTRLPAPARPLSSHPAKVIINSAFKTA